MDGTAGAEGPKEEPSVAPQENIGTAKSALLGSDACKGTDIFITNMRERNGDRTAIDVDFVEFYSVSEGAWKTEGLTNRVVSYGTDELWLNQDLANAENDEISRFRVHYKYLPSGPGANWSSRVYQEIDITNVRCVAGQNFYLTVG